MEIKMDIVNFLKKGIINRWYDLFYLSHPCVKPNFDSKWIMYRRLHSHTELSKDAVQNAEENYPVDFVITWVDESDTNWRNEKQRQSKHMKNYQEKYNSSERYRDWEFFRYWFRSVEKNAPWVRYIFLITYGHLPEWLNIHHPKLKIIRHEDYIPREYLPTFSTRAIELNFYKIEELSEHFVYFNDDMFLVHPVEKKDYFIGGLPRLFADLKPFRFRPNMTSFHYCLINAVGLINTKFNLTEVMEAHPEKWFDINNKSYMNNYYAFQTDFITGFSYMHLPYPFRKSSMHACADYYSDAFHRTCSNRFRTDHDINTQIFLLWEMIHNDFEPLADWDHYGYMTNITKENLPMLQKEIYNTSVKTICINDHKGINDDFDELKKEINIILDGLFPDPSSYEKQ